MMCVSSVHCIDTTTRWLNFSTSNFHASVTTDSRSCLLFLEGGELICVRLYAHCGRGLCRGTCLWFVLHFFSAAAVLGLTSDITHDIFTVGTVLTVQQLGKQTMSRVSDYKSSPCEQQETVLVWPLFTHLLWQSFYKRWFCYTWSVQLSFKQWAVIELFCCVCVMLTEKIKRTYHLLRGRGN